MSDVDVRAFARALLSDLRAPRLVEVPRCLSEPFSGIDSAWVTGLIESTPLLQFPRLRMARGGEALAPREFCDRLDVFPEDPQSFELQASPAKVRALMEDGATAILDRIESYVDGIRAAGRQLGEITSSEVITNLYASDGTAIGFGRHADWCDNLVYQCEGTKTWAFFDRVLSPHDSVNAAGPLFEVTLEEGDWMYVPRGFPHEVQPLGDPTVHAGMAIVPTVLADVVRWHLENRSLVDEGLDTRVEAGQDIQVEVSVKVGDTEFSCDISREVTEEFWAARGRGQFGRL